MKMSSHPSALRSSTLGPQGQYVSTPTESEISANRPPPRFANSSLPKMKRSFPPGIIPPATVAVENARFGAVGVKVAEKRVVQRDIVPTPPPCVAGEHTDIGHEQIEQAVAVVVEKHGAGRVADVSHSRLRGDVAKRPMP